MTVEEIYQNTRTVINNFWFLQKLVVYDRTEATITLHLVIDADLFIQIFLSERSNRLSFALVGRTGRLYGLDCEHGYWHRHPFGAVTEHLPLPDGMSPKPVEQFLTEVETVLVENDLI